MIFTNIIDDSPPIGYRQGYDLLWDDDFSWQHAPLAEEFMISQAQLSINAYDVDPDEVDNIYAFDGEEKVLLGQLVEGDAYDNTTSFTLDPRFYDDIQNGLVLFIDVDATYPETNYAVQINSSTLTAHIYGVYSFKYTYGSGDYYTGTVYADSNQGYYPGYQLNTSDENGQTGTYEITGISPGSSDYAGLVGQVFVNSYYDVESGGTYADNQLVGYGTPVGSEYLGSEHDYIIQEGVPEFYFGAGYYEADVGDYSQYAFNFYYNNGNGDYYTGYVYAPTSFQTNDLQFAVGTKLYDQPMEFWASGYKSFNGSYYAITEITDGFASSYDKKSYITAYYDADTGHASLEVNSDGSATASNIYVSNRTVALETGYAISGTTHDTFSVYKEADVPVTATVSYAAATSPTSTAGSAYEEADVPLALVSYGASMPVNNSSGLLDEDK